VAADWQDSLESLREDLAAVLHGHDGRAAPVMSESDVMALDLLMLIFARWPDLSVVEFMQLMDNARWWAKYLGSIPTDEEREAV
jgi:hypothetical protein